MLRLNAKSFYEVTSGLLTMNYRIDKLRERDISHAHDGSVTISFESDPIAARYLQEQATELLENLKTLGTRISLISAKKLLDMVSDPGGFLWSSVGSLCKEVHDRLTDELSLVTVFVLEEPKAALFEPGEPLFGQEVASKFPSEAAFEIDEAAKCLALGRPTASVFHLMRTMEIGIRSMAKCLGIPDPIKPAERSWGTILKMVRNRIEAKWPTAAARMSGDGAFFEALFASLDAVKNPWRNATMHVENKYTDDEAEHIFVAVRGFMNRLASRCDEAGNPAVQ